jgi:hypothetical protein
MEKNKYLALVILIVGYCLLTSCVKTELSPNKTVSVVNEKSQAKTFSTPDLSIPDGWILIPRPKKNSREVRCA